MSHTQNDDFFKFVGIFIVVVVLVYMLAKFLKLQTKVMEGLTNSTSTDATTNGEAGSASQYSARIKAEVVKMQDALLISKYRADYENILLNLDDYINLLMLKTTLNIDLSADTDGGKPNANMPYFSSLKVLSDAKTSLNGTMKYIDSH